MTKIILEVTEEELERLDSIGIFNPDMAAKIWNKRCGENRERWQKVRNKK